MTDFESSGEAIDQRLMISVQTDRVISSIEALGLEINMDISDVNAFDSMYVYTAERENDESKLQAIKFDLSDFHGSPVTTNQYQVRVVAKQLDEEGLRRVETITIVQDKVADETRLGDQSIALSEPITGMLISISGDVRPQPDRFSHKVELGEFDEEGDYIIDETSDESVVIQETVDTATFHISIPENRRVFRFLGGLTDPEVILGRLEEVLADF